MEEYEAILAVFIRFLESDLSEDKEELFFQMASLRSEFAIKTAIRGFGMEFDTAIELIREFDTSKLTEQEKAQRDIVLAAIDNLIDFATAEEYTMISELPEEYDVDNEDDYETLVSVFSKYNKTYAAVENADIYYALEVAGLLYLLEDRTTLTYMTQQDERVRPWHRQYEGFTAMKKDFPHWLVPPIEHMCRCYLIEDDHKTVFAKTTSDTLEMPEWFNPTFKESVAFGGRIFSEEHPYFQINKSDVDYLDSIAKRIKDQYLNE